MLISCVPANGEVRQLLKIELKKLMKWPEAVTQLQYPLHHFVSCKYHINCP